MTNNQLSSEPIIASFMELLFRLNRWRNLQRPTIVKIFESSNVTLRKHVQLKIFRLIVFIGDNQPCTMKQISEGFAMKPGTATGILDKMVRFKLVNREPNSEDRRKIDIQLGKYGEKIYQKQREYVNNLASKLLSTLEKKEEEFLIQILEKMNRVMKGEGF